MDIKLPMARSGLSVVDAMQSAGTFDDSSVRDGLFLSTLAEKCGWCTERFSPATVAPLERVPHPTMTGVKVAYQYFVRKWWVVGPFERYVNFEQPFITLLPLVTSQQYSAVDVEVQYLNLSGGRRSPGYGEWITDIANPLFRNALPFFEKIKKRFLENCKKL